MDGERKADEPSRLNAEMAASETRMDPGSKHPMAEDAAVIEGEVKILVKFPTVLGMEVTNEVIVTPAVDRIRVTEDLVETQGTSGVIVERIVIPIPHRRGLKRKL